MKITYIFHSGFLIETQSFYFLIDCHADPANVLADLSADKPAIVLVSHSHGDHYNPAILERLAAREGTLFFLSGDVPGLPGACSLLPYETAHAGGVQVDTFSSTDKGVSFIIKADGRTIYHAGDLNWWDWADNTPEESISEAESYKKEIEKISSRKESFDAAFVPLDPRLGAGYYKGFNWFLQTNETLHAIPMHFSGDAAIVDRYLKADVSLPFRDKLLPLTVPGQSAVLQK